MSIREINTETKEGKLLMAALAILTTNSRLAINGKIINGRQTTPDKMLEHLDKLREEIYEI